MSNILDSIQLSGVLYTLSATTSGGTVSSAITSGDTNAVAGGAVYDKFNEVEQVTAAALNDIEENKLDSSAFTTYSASVETALSGKQDTLSAGTNITISGNVISAEGGFDLPIYSGTNTGALILNDSGNTASGNLSVAEGFSTSATSQVAHTEGWKTMATNQACHAEGFITVASGMNSHAEGSYTIANNYSEHASGYYNASSYDGYNSGNTLFSVGNGTSNARHNALEIRQNGDIYLSSGGTDIKLQDHLGGGSITVSSAITSGDTNAVQGGVLWDELRLPVEGESGLTLEWENNDEGYTTNYPSGSGFSKITIYTDVNYGGNAYYFRNSGDEDLGFIDIAFEDDTAYVYNQNNCTYTISGNVITVEYPSIAADVDYIYSPYDNNWTTIAYVNSTVYTPLIDQVSANTISLSGKADTSALSGYVATSAVTSAVTSGSTSVITSGGVYNQMGGMKIVKLTQSAYDALSPNYDANTIYFIVN